MKYQSFHPGIHLVTAYPLLLMLVLFFAFNNIFKATQNNLVLYLLIGTVSWRFLANGTSSALHLLWNAKPCDQDSYPRQVLVLSVVLASFISFIHEFAVLVPPLLILGVVLSPYIFYSFLLSIRSSS